MARKSLTSNDRAEWASELALADLYYEKHIRCSEKYAKAYRDSGELWDKINWPAAYPRTSVNLVFANTQANLARMLMRHPKVQVLPSARATRTFERLQEQHPIDRFVAAALTQQMVNWRWREFDFSRQLKKVALDGELRGIGVARHGFVEEGHAERTSRGHLIRMSTHQHVREGWPYALHQPLDRVRWDVTARDPQERRWVAFLDWWREEDLKARFKIKGRGFKKQVTLGAEFAGNPEALREFGDKHNEILGRVGVWEIWDLRRDEVIWWPDGEDREIQIEDWALETIDGLPDTLLMFNEMADRIVPVPEPDLTWELQQQINQLLSLVLVYAKRGVPLIGINKGGMDEGEAEKILDAEILEQVLTNRDPQEVIKLIGLTPSFQPLLVALQTSLEMHRQVSGNSRMTQGARENVESATEAQAISIGGDLRSQNRVRAIEDFASRLVRKDWQIFAASVTENQVLDIVANDRSPALLELTVDQMRQEYDFSIHVGSTEAKSDEQRKREVLAFMQASQADPEVAPHFNPRFKALKLAQAFDFDPVEAMASGEAADQQWFVDVLQTALFGGNGTGRAGANGSGNGVAASLDALKAGESNGPTGLQ